MTQYSPGFQALIQQAISKAIAEDKARSRHHVVQPRKPRGGGTFLKLRTGAKITLATRFNPEDWK